MFTESKTGKTWSPWINESDEFGLKPIERTEGQGWQEAEEVPELLFCSALKRAAEYAALVRKNQDPILRDRVYVRDSSGLLTEVRLEEKR